MAGALARHDAIVRDAVVSHHGRIVKSTGDGVHAVFANAGDAIDAALSAQVGLADLGTHRLRDVEAAVRVFQVLAPDLESQFPPLTSLDAYRSNLPHELSEFVGRVDDVTAVVKALAEARAV